MALRKTRAAKQAQQEAEKAEAEIAAQDGEAEETVEISQEEASKDASVTTVNSAPQVDDKEAASNTLTMEERLAKMKDLRKKMVRLSHHLVSKLMSHRDLLFAHFDRQILRWRIERQWLQN